jgi:hypothetical protein
MITDPSDKNPLLVTRQEIVIFERLFNLPGAGEEMLRKGVWRSE